MDETQKQELVGLLRGMDEVQLKTDEEGGTPAWYYFRDRVEDVLGVGRGTLDTSLDVQGLTEHDAKVRSAAFQEAAGFVHRTYFGTGSSVEKIVAGLRRMAGKDAS